MADKTAISWTDATWTPIRARRRAPGGGFYTGWHCTHASEGCRNCYAESMNQRLGTHFPFKPGHERDIEIFLDDKMLTQPLRWTKPRMIFVCSMTDLFADFVKDEWIDKMFAVMALCPRHIFQVLTKRPKRMREYLTAAEKPFERIHQAAACTPAEWRWISAARRGALTAYNLYLDRPLPLPNVWLGTSVEDQPNADLRIPDLLATPAALRWISAEPLLGPVDLAKWFWPVHASWPARFGSPEEARAAGAGVSYHRQALVSAYAVFIDWIVAGGESGQHARPMHPNWARSLRDQCATAGVPFHFKQWGEHVPAELVEGSTTREPWRRAQDGRENWRFEELDLPPESLAPVIFERVGKKAAGNLLDGIKHEAFP